METMVYRIGASGGGPGDQEGETYTGWNEVPIERCATLGSYTGKSAEYAI
jgi:hypothetical protein